ncbi:MAG: SAM-dependent methyltransferase [Candidatus Sericytochromatia bacterium]
MDPFKFSAIAHATHRFHNPIALDKLESVFSLLDLRPDDRLIDLGCGNAEMLAMLLARFGGTGLGVDRSPGAIEAARQNTAGRVPAGRLTLIESDARAAAAEASGYGLALHVGGPALQDAPGIQANLATLARVVRPGGYVLAGEGYWRREPSQAYLEALGATRDEMLDHAGNVAAGEAAGLTPWHAVTASTDEWDAYEWRYGRSIEAYALDQPDDPDVPAMLARIRAWRRTYLAGGRDTLGFGLYLFRRP